MSGVWRRKLAISPLSVYGKVLKRREAVATKQSRKMFCANNNISKIPNFSDKVIVLDHSEAECLTCSWTKTYFKFIGHLKHECDRHLVHADNLTTVHFHIRMGF